MCELKLLVIINKFCLVVMTFRCNLETFKPLLYQKEQTRKQKSSNDRNEHSEQKNKEWTLFSVLAILVTQKYQSGTCSQVWPVGSTHPCLLPRHPVPIPSTSFHLSVFSDPSMIPTGTLSSLLCLDSRMKSETDPSSNKESITKQTYAQLAWWNPNHYILKLMQVWEIDQISCWIKH